MRAAEARVAESGLRAPGGRAGADTRERLMDAAERLFAERGFDGVSLREIVAAADVNLGAVHYHFDSKQGLFEAVFARGAQRITQMRVRLLANCVAGPGRPPLLEQVITAFLAPGVIGEREGKVSAVREFLRIRARLVSENSSLARRLLRDHFRTSAKAQFAALKSALPDISEESLRWRYQVLVAALVYTASGTGTVHSLDDAPPVDGMTVLANHVPLLAALFRAPPEAQPAAMRPLLAAIGAG